jgi:uncharacterized protein YgbK (DUF1537 family)
MIPYLLGDDLSGVLEAGAAFRTEGWRVVLPLTAEPWGREPGTLRLVTTESRNLTASEATAAVRRVVADARAAGQTLVFKKIDSTLRGPVGPELGEVLSVLAPRLVVFCPANPAAGRTVRDGVLRVHGVPLAETEFRHDPHWPARESRVSGHLVGHGVPGAAELRLSDLRHHPEEALRRLRSAGPVVLADAEEEDDLWRLVRAAGAVEPATLFVGSGALAAVVARERARGGAAPLPRPDLSRLLILSGTHHPATRRQFDHLARTSGVRVHDHGVGRDDLATTLRALAATGQGHPLAAVRLGADPSLGAQASARLLAAAAEFAAAADLQLQPRAWFVTGGETAWWVCHALRGAGIEVLAELEPGIVASTLRRTGAPPCLLVTKPGGFGDEATLSRICRV